MVTVLSIVVLVLSLSLAFFQAFRNYRAVGECDVRSRVMPRTMCFSAIMFACGLACRAEMPFGLIFDLSTSIMAMYVPALSIMPSDRIMFCSRIACGVMSVISVHYVLCAVDLSVLLPGSMYLALAGVMAVASSVIFMYMIWRRIRDVKSVIKSGNVWSFVTLSVDVVYVSVPLVVILLLLSVEAVLPGAIRVSYVAVIMLMSEMLAIGLKILFDSAFILMHDHERVIVESMKISRADVGIGGEMKGEDKYKELYERILLYFEVSRPYLHGDLTINDVVKVVYSNKVYISQAICHYTGRNFRQFVNYHRVMYSMELFRNNLEMKVAELAEKSGFNNMVSYTMAFRLFMDETPSEWCRKERAKILKPKK